MDICEEHTQSYSEVENVAVKGHVRISSFNIST